MEEDIVNNEKYVKTDMYAEDFLPHGRYRRRDNGDVIELKDNDLHVVFNGKMRQLIAVVDARGVLDSCPICETPGEEGSFVVMTDSHIMYPCWGCDQLIERELDDELRKEDYV